MEETNKNKIIIIAGHLTNQIVTILKKENSDNEYFAYQTIMQLENDETFKDNFNNDTKVILFEEALYSTATFDEINRLKKSIDERELVFLFKEGIGFNRNSDFPENIIFGMTNENEYEIELIDRLYIDGKLDVLEDEWLN